tara:strand:+ start:4502 stop:5392 length:891 start_codon:yes stop_codon:yes gene_type:complete
MPGSGAARTPKGAKDARKHRPVWTKDHEAILVEWADKAACYRWLHSQCHLVYKKRNYWFTIPVIVMSTLTGTANFAQDRFSEEHKPWVSVAIGSINIIAGIFTTIQQFLKISELNEAHRVSSIAWDKFYRNVKVELAKSPLEREPVQQALKVAKEEYDRLMETSPAISQEATEAFLSTFGNTAGVPADELARDIARRRENFSVLKKPEICGDIESTANYVYSGPIKDEGAEIAAAEAARQAEDAARQAQERDANAERERGARESARQAFAAAHGRQPSAAELKRETAQNVHVQVEE